MGGNSGNMCPCMPEQTKGSVTTINVYNRGMVANIAWFFDYSLFTWWMPFENVYENDGTFYAINPAPTNLDI